MSKRLPYLDFKNSHVDIKLKLLMLTLNENRLMNASKIDHEKAKNSLYAAKVNLTTI